VYHGLGFGLSLLVSFFPHLSSWAGFKGRGGSVSTLDGSGRLGRCGGERGWQRLRPVRADGSARVGVGPGVTARSIASSLAPVVGAGGL
jgi:hypothetical protein